MSDSLALILDEFKELALEDLKTGFEMTTTTPKKWIVAWLGIFGNEKEYVNVARTFISAYHPEYKEWFENMLVLL